MPHIDSWNPSVDGPMTEQGLREKLERKGYHVSRYVYPPGTYFADHTHGVDKIDAVVSGRFRLTLEGESVILEATFLGDRLVEMRLRPYIIHDTSQPNLLDPATGEGRRLLRSIKAASADWLDW